MQQCCRFFPLDCDNLHVWVDDDAAEPIPVARGDRLPRGDGSQPQPAPGGGFIARAVVTPRVDYVAGGASAPYVVPWEKPRLAGIPDDHTLSLVSLGSFVTNVVAVFDLAVSVGDEQVHAESLIATWEEGGWRRLTRHPDDEEPLSRSHDFEMGLCIT